MTIDAFLEKHKYSDEDLKLILSALSDENLDAIDKGNWQEVYNSVTGGEKDLVVEAYLRTLCEQGNQWQDIDYETQIKPIEKVLIKWIKELGFRESTNPYMQFIRMFYEIDANKNAVLTENNCISLNNLYADRVLDFADIAGTGESGVNHVIFNNNLYKNNMSDLEFIVKAYESLSSKSFVSKLNVGAITSKFASNLSQDKIDAIKNNGDIYTLRNSIIFKDYAKPQTSEINSRAYIEDLLSIGENNSNTANSNASRIAKDISALSIDDKRSLLNIMLNVSADELNSLVSKLK